MDIAKLIQTLHPLERKVLPILEKTNSFDEIAKQAKLQKVEVMRALQWLQNKKIISLRQELKEIISLDENGIKYREKGLPEKKFLSILETEIPLSSIPEKTGLGKDEIGMSIGLLKQKNAIEVKADVFAQTGDVFDVRNPEAEHVAVINRCIKRLSVAGIPSIWLMGNHDYKKSGDKCNSKHFR